MVVDINIYWLYAVILVAARLSAMLLFSPLFSLAQLPNRIKMVFIVVMSAAVASLIPHEFLREISGVGSLFVALVQELMIGGLMFFSVACAFAAFTFAGGILDLQMGFGVASLINPATQEQAPLMGTALAMVAVMTFFLLNGHHWIAKGFIQSYSWFPIGAPIKSISLPAIVAQFGLMFTLGFMLVAPVVTAMLLIDIGMAISARTMPQMNVFLLSIPIKIIVGCLVLAASIPYMNPLFQRAYRSIFSYWQNMV